MVSFCGWKTNEHTPVSALVFGFVCLQGVCLILPMFNSQLLKVESLALDTPIENTHKIVSLFQPYLEQELVRLSNYCSITDQSLSFPNLSTLMAGKVS